MKKENILCDICDGVLNTGYNLSLKRKPKRHWWYRGVADRSEDVDICDRCLTLIERMSHLAKTASSEYRVFRAIFEVYSSMCVTDQRAFVEELWEIAKKSDGYFSKDKEELRR